MPKHDHDHDRPESGKPGHRGPKERELATSLTVAILRSAQNGEKSADQLADQAAGIYAKMLDLVGTT
jgi:hypothetical protein